MLARRTEAVLPSMEARTSARSDERLLVPDYAAAFYMQERNSLIDSLQDYTTITITTELEGAPDLISYRYYGTTSLYWLLCFYNGVIFPDEEIVTGMQFKVPNVTSVNSYLSTLNVKRFDSRIGKTLSF